ncbi:MAG: ABC transporter ATP-binding protein [Chloroflexota bacterium]
MRATDPGRTATPAAARPRTSEPLVVDRLNVAFAKGRRPVVRDVSFAVAPGEAVGLVGESGSGKSLTLRSVLGLLPNGAVATGRIAYGDTSLLELSGKEMQRMRGSRIGMVFQDPMSALNPILRVGDAIAQVIRSHEKVDGKTAHQRAVAIMERVGIRDAASRASSYPHQFSGGMRQRIVVAMALAANPTLLLADEPTTALDVVVQAAILRLLDDLRRERGMSLLLVSHDFGVVVGVCDRVGVMYAGELVELGPTREVLRAPRHPYTRGLVDSLPEAGEGDRMTSIPGSPPEPGALPPGCPFAPRCELATAECTAGPIPLREVAPGRHARCLHSDQVPPPAAVLRAAAAALPVVPPLPMVPEATRPEPADG